MHTAGGRGLEFQPAAPANGNAMFVDGVLYFT